MILVMLDMFVGMLLFYNYLQFSQIQQPDGLTKVTKFQESKYQSVLKEWSNRDAMAAQPLNAAYQDPFDYTIIKQ